ncbi:hypothetical protein OJF2_12130 [Aquisphaera giovannonii]|uniref:Uncharacterized protein n=1 Tax=Aquisphaera giovannonii TaxID=406548 RepID=A0A5B9VXC4_9BACT|nr:hypothetical protein [Aquisphaera giovannonii]QEH32734.1 hypothetical protein OJF2_12130 [Aquisphaera giovannonii]
MSEPERSDRIESPAPRCRHLRSPGLYVFTDGRPRERPDDANNTIYWCVKTLKGYGPDDENVAWDDCSDPARSCYEPF